MGSAGFDISAILAKGESKLVKTSIAFEVPRGTYGRLASPSSLAWRHGIEVGAGELMVLLHNRSCQGIEFEVGDRVAHLVLEKIETPRSRVAQDLTPTDRGGQGFVGCRTQGLLRPSPFVRGQVCAKRAGGRRR